MKIRSLNTILSIALFFSSGLFATAVKDSAPSLRNRTASDTNVLLEQKEEGPLLPLRNYSNRPKRKATACDVLLAVGFSVALMFLAWPVVDK